MSFDDLIQNLPSKEKMAEVHGKVSELVKALSQEATRFAEKYRMRGPIFIVGMKEEPKTVEELVKMLTTRGHRFVISRMGDAWDVYHSETPSIWNLFNRQEGNWNRIQACRMDVKILFIKNAKTIFTEYFKHITDFLENAPKEIAHAEAVIRELQELLKPVEQA